LTDSLFFGFSVGWLVGLLVCLLEYLYDENKQQLHCTMVSMVLFPLLMLGFTLRYGDSVDNTVEANSSIFSLIQMHWLLSARACWQQNSAPTKSSSS